MPRLVELEGEDHLPWTDNYEDIVAEIEEFVTGARTVPEPDRVLATVLFTDIVDSTEDRLRSRAMHAWRETLDRHDRISVSEIERFRGRRHQGNR